MTIERVPVLERGADSRYRFTRVVTGIQSHEHNAGRGGCTIEGLGQLPLSVRYISLQSSEHVTGMSWVSVGKQGIVVHRSAGLLGDDAGHRNYSRRSHTTVISEAEACELQDACGNPMRAVFVSPCALVLSDPCQTTNERATLTY